MNIQIQACGLIILFLIVYFYKRQDTVGLYTEKLFEYALYVCITCLILDILSIVLIVNLEKLPQTLVEIECKMYLASLIWTGYSALVYTCADAFRLIKANRFVILMGVAAGIITLIVFLVPINIFNDGNAIYTYGPACIATYAGAFSLIIVTLLRVTMNGQIMNPRRRRAIRNWMLMWILAAVIQFFNSRLLLVGFAGALGIVILFFELENPETNIDKKTGFFNAGAFVDLIKQRYHANISSSGILISLEGTHSNNVQLVQIDDALIEVAEFLRSIPDAKKFKTDEREYVLLFDDIERMNKAYEMIDERFQREWLEGNGYVAPIMLQPYCLLVPSGKVTRSAEEMLSLLRYFRTHTMDNPEEHTIILDEISVAGKRAREEMLGTINAAMEDDRVEVFFQPIYSMRENKFVSAEALVRIRKEDGGIIPPGLFIPVAEKTGLIGKLGERVFEKTCSFIKDNKIEQYGVKYVEINLSVVQCENKALANRYIDIMSKYEISPSFINLEITESASVIMKKTLLDNMMALIEYGVAFSLDDFGNGESNLNYIVDMPVRVVKFDKDMTQAYFENEKAKYVLQAATDMIQGLELEIVAEGVETAEQLKELERLGIDYIQGYYFSKPLDERQYIEFLKKNNA